MNNRYSFNTKQTTLHSNTFVLEHCIDTSGLIETSYYSFTKKRRVISDVISSIPFISLLMVMPYKHLFDHHSIYFYNDELINIKLDPRVPIDNRNGNQIYRWLAALKVSPL